MRTMPAATAAPRAGGGAAGDVLEVPGVTRGRERQVERGAADGELMRRELADQHAATGRQLLRHHAIGGGHIVDQQLGVAGRADARGLVDVLQRIGDALHRPRILPGGEGGVGAAGIVHGAVGGYGDEGVQRAVLRGHPVQRRAGQRLGRGLLGAELAAHRRDGGAHQPAIRCRREDVGRFHGGGAGVPQQLHLVAQLGIGHQHLLAQVRRHGQPRPLHGNVELGGEGFGGVRHTALHAATKSLGRPNRFAHPGFCARRAPVLGWRVEWA